MDDLRSLLSSSHLRRRYEAWRLDDTTEAATVIVLYGQWNAGKSSLINALLDAPDLLPTGPTPETGLPVAITFGDDSSAAMELGSVKHPIFGRNELQKAIRRGGGDRVVHLSTPKMPWKGTVLVDLPGVNSVADAHNLVAADFLPKADALVYVMRADQAPQAVDLQALAAITAQLPPAHVHIAVTHAAALGRADREELAAHIRALVPKTLSQTHFVDSLAHFENLSGNTGIPALRSALEGLVREGASLRAMRRARRRADLAREELRLCDAALVSMRSAAESTQLELRNRAARARAARTSLDAYIQSLQLQIRSTGADEADALSRKIEQLRQENLSAWRGASSKDLATLEKLLNQLATQLSASYQTALQNGRNKLLETLEANSSSVSAPEISIAFAHPDLAEPLRAEDMLAWIPSGGGVHGDGGQDDILGMLKGLRDAAKANPLWQVIEYLLEIRGRREMSEKLTRHVVEATLKANESLVDTFRDWWRTWTTTVLDELSTSLTAPLVEEVRLLEDAPVGAPGALAGSALERREDQAARLREWLKAQSAS